MIDSVGCLGNTIKVSAGHYVDLLDPSPDMIDIESIAAALSKICRFGGQCPKFYSVAEHCYLATKLAWFGGCSTESLRAVLLHDAAEAYVGDIVKPLKIILPEYAAIEHRMEAVIEARFNVSFSKHKDTIKQYDWAMLKAEKENFWPNDPHVWEGFPLIENYKVNFEFFGPEEAEYGFLSLARLTGVTG